MRTKLICVYCVENLVNGKKYIGGTTNYSRRKITHKCLLKRGSHYNDNLQDDYNKYGKSSFMFYPIEIVEKEYLLDQEDYWIDQLHTMVSSFGYNLQDNKTKTQELVEKIVRRGKESPWYGRKHTIETKNKIRMSRIGKYVGINSPIYGVKKSLEHIHKISEMSKLRIGPKNHRYGTIQSEETKKLIAEVKVKNWKSRNINRIPVSEMTRYKRTGYFSGVLPYVVAY